MNPNVSDTNALLRGLDAEFARKVAVVYFYLVTVMTSGLLGNLLVIVVYVTKFKATTTRTFVVTLAVLDLMVCVHGLPLELVNLAGHYTFPSPVLCKWYATFNAFCALASVLLLLVVAGDRYRRICRPLKVQLTPQNARKASLCCSVAAMLLVWPFAVLWGDATQHTGIANVTGTKCNIDDGLQETDFPLVYNAILFVLFIGSFVVLVTLYALIYGQIRRQLRLHGCPAGPEIRVSLATVVPSMGGLASGETTNEANRISPAGAPDQVAGAECLQKASSADSQGATSSELEKAPGSEGSGNADELTQDTPRHRENRPVTISWSELTQSELYHQDNRPRTSSLSNLKRVFFGKSVDLAPCGHEGRDAEICDPCHSCLNRKLTTQISVSRSTDDDSEFTDATFVQTAVDIRSNVQEVSSSGEQNPPSGQPVRPRTARFGTLELPGLCGLKRKMKKRAEAVRKTTLTLFLVTLIFVLSFLPYLVATVLQVLQMSRAQAEQGSSDLAHEFFVRSFYLQNAANPFIYGFRNPVFRAKCRQLLSRRR